MNARLERRAYRIGSRDAYAGKGLLNVDDAESAVLMDELGETGDTTAANWVRRSRLCDAYRDGWFDARSAIAEVQTAELRAEVRAGLAAEVADMPADLWEWTAR